MLYNQSPQTAYATKGFLPAISPETGRQLAIQQVVIGNSCGSAIAAGIIELFHTSAYKAGQYVESTTSYTDDTTDAQSTASGDFAATTTTNNDGFAVQSLKPFNLIVLDVSQAQAGSPVYEYKYWDGSAYQTLNTYSVPASYTVAKQYIVFHAPIDWVKGGPSGKGYDADMYHIRVRATTAPSTAVLATQVKVGSFLAFNESLEDNNQLILEYDEDAPLILMGGSSVMPYFATADNNNFISANYRSV